MNDKVLIGPSSSINGMQIRSNLSGMLSRAISQVRCGGDYNPKPPAYRTSNRSWKVGLALDRAWGEFDMAAAMTTKFGFLTHASP